MNWVVVCSLHLISVFSTVLSRSKTGMQRQWVVAKYHVAFFATSMSSLRNCVAAAQLQRQTVVANFFICNGSQQLRNFCSTQINKLWIGYHCSEPDPLVLVLNFSTGFSRYEFFSTAKKQLVSLCWPSQNSILLSLNFPKFTQIHPNSLRFTEIFQTTQTIIQSQLQTNFPR